MDMLKRANTDRLEPASFMIETSLLYRLPWTLRDNILIWLEPTKNCNISCAGCFAENDPGGHKNLSDVKKEIASLAAACRADVLAIGGGEPLTHPDIIEIVRSAAQNGFKPFVNTNGVLATPELLVELKNAGLKGLTFHVDSLQNRPGWEGKTEEGLNVLRQRYADMTALAGGLSCYFSSTVTKGTLYGIPVILEWAENNPELVHLVVFVAFRDPSKIIAQDAASRPKNPDEISIPDMIGKVKAAYPDFLPCGFVDGAAKPGDVKWLVSLRAVGRGGVYGYLGSKFLEAFQALNHLLRGRYPGRVSPLAQRMGKSLLALSCWDPGAAGALFSWARSLYRDPAAGLAPLNIQAVLFIQPVTVVKDGLPKFFA